MADITYTYGKNLLATNIDLEDLKGKLSNMSVRADFAMPLYTNPWGPKGKKTLAGFVATQKVKTGVQDVNIAWRGIVLQEEWKLDSDIAP